MAQGIDPTLQQALLDFSETITAKPNLTDKEIFQKFPEFNNDANTLQSAKDYAATLNSGKYKTTAEINAKFPEFDLKKKVSSEPSQPVSPVGTKSTSPYTSPSLSATGLEKVTGGLPGITSPLDGKKPVAQPKFVDVTADIPVTEKVDIWKQQQVERDQKKVELTNQVKDQVKDWDYTKLIQTAKKEQSENKDLSTALYDAAIDKNPSDPQNYAEQAYNYAQQGNIQKTIENAQASAALYDQQQLEPGVTDRGNPGVYQLLSWAKLQNGDYAGAIQDGDRAIELQGYQKQDDDMSMRDEKAYKNLALTYSYNANAASKIGDEAMVKKYTDGQNEATIMANRVEGAKNTKLNNQYIASGQFMDDVIGQVPILRQVMNFSKGASEGLGSLREGEIHKGVNELIGAGFAAGMAVHPTGEVAFYVAEKLIPEEYMKWGMQTVTSIAQEMGKDTSSEWFVSADIAVMTALMALAHAGISKAKAGFNAKDYAEIKSDAGIIRKASDREQLTTEEAKRFNTLVEDAPVEIVKAAVNKVEELKSIEKNVTFEEQRRTPNIQKTIDKVELDPIKPIEKTEVKAEEVAPEKEVAPEQKKKKDSDLKGVDRDSIGEDKINEWVLENSDKPQEVKDAYEAEKALAPYEMLEPWQKQVVDGAKITKESFESYGDRNNISSGLAKRFFKSKEKGGKPLDTYITDVLGIEDLTPSEVADFMVRVANERGIDRKTTNLMNPLLKKYRELTGMSLKHHAEFVKKAQETKLTEDIEQKLATFENKKEALPEYMLEEIVRNELTPENVDAWAEVEKRAGVILDPFEVEIIQKYIKDEYRKENGPSEKITPDNDVLSPKGEGEVPGGSKEVRATEDATRNAKVVKDAETAYHKADKDYNNARINLQREQSQRQMDAFKDGTAEVPMFDLADKVKAIEDLKKKMEVAKGEFEKVKGEEQLPGQEKINFGPQELGKKKGATKNVVVLDPDTPWKKPKLISQIISGLADKIGSKVSISKLSMRNASGTYAPGNSLIRLKRANDLNTAIHEMAHFLDDKYKVLENEMGRADLKPELERYYDTAIKTNTQLEGFAGWMEEYVINPKQARLDAPKIAELYDKKISASDKLAIDEFSNDVRNFSTQTSLDRYSSIIESEEKPKTTWNKLVDYFGVTDKNTFVKNWVSVYSPMRSAWNDLMKMTGENPAEVFGRKNFSTMLKMLFGEDRKFEHSVEKGFSNTNLETLVDKKTGQNKNIDWLIGRDLGLKGDYYKEAIRNTVNYMTAKRTVEFAENMKQRLLNEAVEKLDSKIAENEKKVSKIDDQLKSIEEEKNKKTGGLIPLDQIKEQEARFDGNIEILNSQREKLTTEINNFTTERNSLTPDSFDLTNKNITGVGGGYFSDLKNAQKAMSEVEAIKSSDPKMYNAMQELDRRYKSLSDDILQYYRDSEVISKEAYADIKKNNQEYVALKRIMEESPMESKDVSFGSSNMVGSVSDLIKQFKGSSRTIIDPYSALLNNMYKYVREADKNRVMRVFTDALDNVRDMHEGSVSEIAKIGYEVKKGDTYDIKVYSEGKEKYYRVSPDIKEAIESINEAGKTLPAILTFLPAIMKQTVTKAPQFLVRNVIRDQSARLFISQGKVSYSDYQKYSKAKDELIKAGGGQFGYFEKSKTSYYKMMEKYIKEANAGNKDTVIPMRYLKNANPLKWYNWALQNSEVATRAAEFNSVYKKMKKLGLDDVDAKLEAMRASRELLDFKEIGKNIKTLNQLIPFLNPRIQGFRVMINSIKRDPKKFAMRFALYGVTAELAQALIILGTDDDTKERYSQLQPYRKTLFFNIPAGDGWIMIPKPFEYGAMASIAGRAFDSAILGDDRAFDKDFWKSMGSVMNPVDPAMITGQSNVLKDIMSNYDSFRQQYIVPPYEQGTDVELRKGADKASEIGKSVASVLNKSGMGVDPRQVDHFIRSEFSYFGDMAYKLSKQLEGEKDMGWEATSLYKANSDLGSKDVQWVWDTANRYKMVSDPEYKHFMSLVDEYQSIEDEYAKKKLGKEIVRTATEIRELWKEKDLLSDAKARIEKEENTVTYEGREYTKFNDTYKTDLGIVVTPTLKNILDGKIKEK